jgi:hypothetical protein
VDFGGEEEFGPAAGARPGTSRRDVPTFKLADEEEFEAFAVEAVRANDEMLGGF